MDVSTQHQILENGHVAKKFYVLECSCHSPPSDRARFAFGEFANLAAIVELNGALLRAVQATDAIEKACLTGPVRTDYRVDQALPDNKIDTSKRLDAAERKEQPAGFELGITRLDRASVQIETIRPRQDSLRGGPQYQLNGDAARPERHSADSSAGRLTRRDQRSDQPPMRWK